MNKRVMVVAGGAAVLVLVVLAGLIWHGLAQCGPAKDLASEYSSVWQAYTGERADLDSAVEDARMMLDECVEETSGAVACVRLNAAVERAGGLAQLHKLEDGQTTKDDVEAVKDVTSKVAGLREEIVTQQELVKRERTAARSQWVTGVLEPELSRADSVLEQARQAAGGAQGRLADDGVRTQLLDKISQLESLVVQTRSRSGELTVSEGQDRLSALSVVSAEVEEATRTVRAAVMLADQGVSDVQGG